MTIEEVISVNASAITTVMFYFGVLLLLAAAAVFDYEKKQENQKLDGEWLNEQSAGVQLLIFAGVIFALAWVIHWSIHALI